MAKKYFTDESLSTFVNETKSYTDNAVSTKAPLTHDHDADYDEKDSAKNALASAKEYTDTKTSSLASTTVVDNKITIHNTNASAHNDIRTSVNNAASAAATAQSRADSAYTLANSKQDKLTGTAGQFVVIGDDGNVTTKTVAIAEEASF